MAITAIEELFLQNLGCESEDTQLLLEGTNKTFHFVMDVNYIYYKCLSEEL
jgi:hypothetical protein